MTELAAIYARVSTDEQAQAGTVQAQLEACRAYCLQQGWEVVQEYIDEGVSGAVPLEARPAGSRLVVDSQAGRFHVVVVSYLDRLSRDVPSGATAYRRLKAQGTPVVAVHQQFDASPLGSFLTSLFFAFAEYERNLITERTKAGRYRRVREGKYQASIRPYGYLYDRATGQLVPHPEEAERVRRMFRWAREGMGLRAIAERLMREGAPLRDDAANPNRRGVWHVTTVYKILTSPRYIGHTSYGPVEMRCPPLVDQEAYFAVQEGLRRRRRDAPRNSRHFYLLRHVLYCRTCGSRCMGKTITWQYVRRRGELVRVTLPEPRRVYLCRARAHYGPRLDHQGAWRVPCRDADAAVLSALRRLVAHPREVVARALERWLAEAEAARDSHDTAALEARLARLEAEELRLVRAYRRGLVSEGAFAEEMGEIQRERQDLRRRLQEAQAARPPAREELEAAADAVRRYLEGAGLMAVLGPDGTMHLEPGEEEWREALLALGARAWLEPDGSVSLELPFKAPDSPQSR